MRQSSASRSEDYGVVCDQSRASQGSTRLACSVKDPAERLGSSKGWAVPSARVTVACGEALPPGVKVKASSVVNLGLDRACMFSRDPNRVS